VLCALWTAVTEVCKVVDLGRAEELLPVAEVWDGVEAFPPLPHLLGFQAGITYEPSSLTIANVDSMAQAWMNQPV